MGQILQRCRWPQLVKPMELFSVCVLSWSLKCVNPETQGNVPSWDTAVTAETVMQGHVYAVPCCATPEPQLALEKLVCLCSIVQGHTAVVSLLRPPCPSAEPGAVRLRGSMSRLHVSL